MSMSATWRAQPLMISTSVLVNAVTVEPVAAATSFARCGSIAVVVCVALAINIRKGRVVRAVEVVVGT